MPAGIGLRTSTIPSACDWNTAVGSVEGEKRVAAGLNEVVGIALGEEVDPPSQAARTTTAVKQTNHMGKR